MILLNGVEAEESEIDPKRYRFLGTFRWSYPEQLKRWKTSGCPCGAGLYSPYKNEFFEHWQLGHFDIPQYVSILVKSGGRNE